MRRFGTAIPGKVLLPSYSVDLVTVLWRRGTPSSQEVCSPLGRDSHGQIESRSTDKWKITVKCDVVFLETTGTDEENYSFMGKKPIQRGLWPRLLPCSFCGILLLWLAAYAPEQSGRLWRKRKRQAWRMPALANYMNWAGANRR